MVSTHLDNRHGGKAKDAKMSRLRVAQAAADGRADGEAQHDGAADHLRRRHQLLVDGPQQLRPAPLPGLKGYRDTVSDREPDPTSYPTVNHWSRALKTTKRGTEYGSTW